MSNVLREYLVNLGFSVDQPELDKFTSALDRLDKFTESSTESMAGSFAKFFVGANAGIATVAAGLVGLVDHVAMADQEYRLFAIHSYMNQDAAKGFKIALDSLGVSLGDIYRDPELYGRFTQLLKDQAEMQKGTGGDFEKTMRQARDLRFEFSRLHVEVQYGMMGMASAIFKGFGGEDFLSRFKRFNDWLITSLPHLVEIASTQLKPILQDMVAIGKETFDIFKNLSTIFVQFTGEVAGDEGLKTGEANFANLAKATKIWLDALLHVVQELDHIIALFTAHPEMVKIPGGAALGASIGGAPGALVGAAGGAAWSIYSDLKKPAIAQNEANQSQAEYEALHATRLQSQAANIGKGINTPTEQQIIKAAKDAGVPENIALSVAYQESRFNQSAVSPKGAIGVMQLMPGTAAGLGVNPNDEEQNIEGGMKYLRQLYDNFGNWSKAVQAYNSGPDNVMKGIVPEETQVYVPEVMGRAFAIEDAWGRYHAGSRAAVQPMAYHQATEDHSIEIHNLPITITNPSGVTPENVKTAVAEGVREGIGRQNAQNHFELSGSYA